MISRKEIGNLSEQL